MPSSGLIEFHATVLEFLSFAEEHSLSLSEKQAVLQELLAKLYSRAIPVFSESAPSEAHSFGSVNEFEKNRVSRRFSSLPFTYYFCATHPHSEEAKAVIPNSIVEDLAEVYEELKSGLAFWSREQHEEAVAIWGSGFHGGWGLRALCALYALHTYTKDDATAA